MDKSWSKFWDGQNVFSDLTLEKNMNHFLNGIKEFVDFKEDDLVLDIGCGPGALPKLISSKVREIHCMDTSEKYIKQNQINLSNLKNVYFYKLEHEDYLNFRQLGERKFSIIIASTMVQYYKSMADVQKLIENICKFAKPGARAIITDLPLENNVITDVISQISEGFKENYLIEVLKTFFRARFSEYYPLRSNLLVINPIEMEFILNKHKLKYSFIDADLSVNKGRKHLLINF